MGSQYGDARLELLFDFDTLVRITDVPDILRRVQKLAPTKYLVVPNTDLIFPNDCLLESNGLSYEAKATIKPNLPGQRYPQVERKDIEKCNPGDSYTITLIKPVLRIDTELERMKISRTDDSHGNIFVFSPGELEVRLSTAKESFDRSIRASLGVGLTDKNINGKIYSRIVANAFNF